MRTAFALCALLAVAALPALADEKPLRHLTFSYELGVSSTYEQPTSGLRFVPPSNRNMGGGMMGVSGSAKQRSGATIVDNGTIVADVLSATSDGGLIVTISEYGRERKRASTKVGIRDDGALLIDPSADLTDESRYLLGLLARRLIEGEPRVGKVWRFERAAPKNSSDVTTYRILGINDAIVHLSVDRVALNRTLQGFDLHASGTVDYNWRQLVPASAKIHSILKSTSGDGLVTTVETDCVLTLTDDSFRR